MNPPPPPPPFRRSPYAVLNLPQRNSHDDNNESIHQQPISEKRLETHTRD